MPKRKAILKSRVVAWWLSGGEEECAHCGRLYALEMEFRCPDCDGPSCPHCKKQHAEDRDVCPECVEKTEENLVQGDRAHG
jgi:hypothetical protein